MNNFEFEIGEDILVADGWERPLFPATISNRRAGSSGNEYLLGTDKTTIYNEHQLKKRNNNET